MFVASLAFVCLFALWLDSGLTIITIGLFVPVVVVMLYVFSQYGAGIIAKLVGGIIAFGGTLYWAWIVADSNNPNRPGDLPVAAMFFGVPGTAVSILAGVFIIVVFSDKEDSHP